LRVALFDLTNQTKSSMLDLKTLESCRLDIEALSRELLLKRRRKVSRELQDLCRILRSRVIASHQFKDVVEPFGRIADAAARLENAHTSKDEVATYELRQALHSLTVMLVDYRARSPPDTKND
jgi:hypothetical protein